MKSSCCSTHLSCHFLQVFQWKRRHTEWFHSNAHQFHGIIIGCNSVRREYIASLAAMHNRPLSTFTNPYRNWFHDTTAVCQTIPRFHVNMQTGKTIWAVITVFATCTSRNNLSTTHPTNKSIMAGMCFIVAFFILLAFMITIQNDFLLKCNTAFGRNAESYADLPVSVQFPF